MQRLGGANQRQLGMRHGNGGVPGQGQRPPAPAGIRPASCGWFKRAWTLNIGQFGGPGGFERGHAVISRSGITREISVQQFGNLRDFHGWPRTAVMSDK